MPKQSLKDKEPRLLKSFSNMVQHSKRYSKNEIKERITFFPTYKSLKEAGRFIYKHKASDDFDPFKIEYHWRTKFKIFAECCICGNKKGIALHHINSLRKIPKEKRISTQYIRSQINRLQIPVCYKCHQDITYGKYNQQNPMIFFNEFIAKL